jgi:hypothetical protein
MGCDEQDVGPKVFKVETVRGEPYLVAGHKLTPVTRIVSLAKANATIGRNRVSGLGGGVVRVIPVAVLDEAGGERREIAIYDATAAAVQRMVAIALAATFFLATVRWWVRRGRQARSA